MLQNINCLLAYQKETIMFNIYTPASGRMPVSVSRMQDNEDMSIYEANSEMNINRPFPIFLTSFNALARSSVAEQELF